MSCYNLTKKMIENLTEELKYQTNQSLSLSSLPLVFSFWFLLLEKFFLVTGTRVVH